MSDHCGSETESWAGPSALMAESSWISAAFDHETEALTKALQIALSNTSNNTNMHSGSSSVFAAEPPSVQILDPLACRTRVVNRIPAAQPGRISKRRSRASKRATTTYIAADAANFRQMVQQVTGVRAGDGSIELGQGTEPVRCGPETMTPESCCLPTLDTSAFFLNRAGFGAAAEAASCSFGAAAAEGLLSFDFEPGMMTTYPTLESWGAM